MESGDLENEYVQSFELDRFGEVEVKREANNNSIPNAMINCEESTNLHHVKLPPMPLMPPNPDYASLHPHHQAHGVLMRATGPLPFSPPDTPPEGSPTDQFHHLNNSPPIPCLHSRNGPNFDDHLGNQLVWLAPPMRQEPLDLRPCNDEGDCWNPKNSVITHPVKRSFQPTYGSDYLSDELSPVATVRPMMCRSNMTSPKFNGGVELGGKTIITDELLVTLPVRDLNKKLQPFPKEVVLEYKQKRRTLKNRGYAQNCRSKRLMQKKSLEKQNKALQAEMNLIKEEIKKAMGHCTCGIARRIFGDKIPINGSGVRFPEQMEKGHM